MKIIKLFKKYWKEFKRGLFYIIDYLIKKDKNIIIIGSNATKYLSGNSLAIYNYIIKNTRYKVYFFSYNKFKNIKTINEKNIKNLLILFKAKTFIMTHGARDFGEYWDVFFKKNRILIQTWHGLPLKTLGLFDKTLATWKLKKALKISKKYTYFITTSTIQNAIFSSSYNINISKFIITGYPRNDNLFKKQNKTNTFKNYKLNISEDDFCILYAPTFREWTETKLFPFNDFDSKQLVNLLEKNNIKIFLRLHLNEKIDNNKNNFLNSKNIIIFDNNTEPEINNVLNCFDLLITDYSSIFLDFLLINKPIFFFPYDYEDYNKKHGFYFDYFYYTPGPKIFSFEKFLYHIRNILKHNDLYENHRKIILNLMHKYIDGNSTKRFMEFLKNILE